jgi:hypothetical protein
MEKLAHVSSRRSTRQHQHLPENKKIKKNKNTKDLLTVFLDLVKFWFQSDGPIDELHR